MILNYMVKIYYYATCIIMIYKKTNKFKTFRIFETYNSISLLNDKNINQYFIDTTYKSVPKDLNDAKALLIIIGYNYTKDIFELILVALLSLEDTNI